MQTGSLGLIAHIATGAMHGKMVPIGQAGVNRQQTPGSGLRLPEVPVLTAP